MVSTELNERLNQVVAQLNGLEAARHALNGYTHAPDVVRWSERTKYCAIDIGSSGAWLVDKESGELFNIKAYGVADQNKKRKANLGNIYTCDVAVLHTKRYNYLR